MNSLFAGVVAPFSRETTVSPFQVAFTWALIGVIYQRYVVK